MVSQLVMAQRLIVITTSTRPILAVDLASDRVGTVVPRVSSFRNLMDPAASDLHVGELLLLLFKVFSLGGGGVLVKPVLSFLDSLENGPRLAR